MPTIEISQENYDKLEALRKKTEFYRRMGRQHCQNWEAIVVTLDDVLCNVIRDDGILNLLIEKAEKYEEIREIVRDYEDIGNDYNCQGEK